MGFQEFAVLIIVSSAIIYTSYKFIRTIIMKDENSGHCSTCPYSGKNGACTK